MKILGLLFLLTATFGATQKPSRPASPPTQFEKFTLTLATPKSKYVELEPIPIILTLKNETDKPLVGHTVFMFGGGYVRLYVIRDDGRHEVKPLTLRRALISAKPREFVPAQEASDTELLDVALNKLFPKPGKYQLQAKMMSRTGSVWSKPVDIEVVEAEGDDAEALRFIRATKKPEYFFTGADLVGNSANAERLKTFVAVYGDTVYGDYATHMLAQLYHAKREYESARPLLEMLSKKKDYAFAADAAQYLQQMILNQTRLGARTGP